MADPREKSPDADEFRSTHAIRDAIPTRRHSEMLFEMVVDHLGEEAWIETLNGETTRTLFRREAPGSKWILPWPLLSVTRGGREGPSPVMTAVPGVYEEPKPRPGPAPKLRDLGAGSVQIHDGPHSVTVCYGADGRWFEMTRGGPSETLAGVIAALEAKNAPPVELVASFVSGLDIARHGPGRVHMPVPLPGGARGVWSGGLHTIRDRLFRERPARSNVWYATDGWLGKILTYGETRENAGLILSKAVLRERPFPSRPQAPTEPLPETSMEQSREENGFSIRATLRGPSSDVPWVEPTPENTPSAALQVGEIPARPLPTGWHWCWIIGSSGNAIPAAMLWQPKGITVVGDRLLEVLDMDRLEDLLVEANRTAPPRPTLPPEFASAPPADSRCRTYRLVDEKTRAPVPPTVVSSSWSKGFDAGNIDGDHLRWNVLRQRIVNG